MTITQTEERLFDYAAEIKKLEDIQLEYELRAQAEHLGTIRNQVAYAEETGNHQYELLRGDLYLTVQYIQIVAREIERRFIP